MTKEVLFKIYIGDRSKPEEPIEECIIYSDGMVEGFPGPVLGILNGHFAILNRELAKLKLEYEEKLNA